MANAGASALEIRRVVFASFIGTTIEWYDFFIYGTAAALSSYLLTETLGNDLEEQAPGGAVVRSPAGQRGRASRSGG